MVKKITISIHLLAACLLVQLPAVAQRFFPDEPDVIEFNNDDKMQGKLKRIQRGELKFDPDILEDLFTTKLRNVKYIRARRKEYMVETINNSKYYGTIDIGKAPGWVKVISISDTIDIHILDLDNIENLDDNFWRRLDGNINFGFSYSRHSNIGRINGNHSMAYSTRKWTFKTNGDLMYTIADEFKGVEKADWALQAYFEFWKKWFTLSQAQFQRSTELGLDARFQVLKAAGPIIIKNRRNDLRIASGLSAQKEYSTDSMNSHRNISMEIPLIVNYWLFKLGSPEIKLQATNSLFFSISQNGRWRDDQNIVLYWEIVTHLNLNIQLYMNYDSKPPNVDAQKVDYGAVFSVGYSW